MQRTIHVDLSVHMSYADQQQQDPSSQQEMVLANLMIQVQSCIAPTNHSLLGEKIQVTQ